MEKMKSDVPLDYAVFQLSPKRTRCELFVSSGGSTEKLASGFVKPFVAHLKVVEEQVASAAQSVKLEAGRRKNAEVWFTKGTLERFVRFVSTPEVLELVNSSDAEMSQLEAARRIYSLGGGDQHSGGGGSGATATDDATKMELLRAIDVRLMAVQQDLSTACTRAAAAGFNVDTVSELQTFADRFGAHRLNEACSQFISVCERRPNIISQWKPGPGDRTVRSSCESDMSIDNDPSSPPPRQEPTTCQQPNPPPVTFSNCTFSRESSVERDNESKSNGASGEKLEASTPEQTDTIQASQPARRLSVQDRINLFENKQKESSGSKSVVVKSVELRRMSSDVSTAAAADKSVLRRWSGASDMSIDLSAEKKDGESTLCTPSSASISQENKVLNANDDTAKNSPVIKPGIKPIHDINFREGSNKPDLYFESGKLNSNLALGESDGLKGKILGKPQLTPLTSTADNLENSEEKFKNLLSGKTESAFVFGDQGKLKGSQSSGSRKGAQSQISGIKEQDSPVPQIKPVETPGGGQVYSSSQREYSEALDVSSVPRNLKSTLKTRRGSGVSEDIPGSRIRDAFVARYKGAESDFSSAQQDIKSGETEAIEKKESPASEKVSSGSISEVEGSGPQKIKSIRRGLVTDQSKKGKVQQDESHISGKNSRAPYLGKATTEAVESFDSFSTPPPEKFQRVRQSKGNQELNDELKMKANELEKLFAEHKLRVPSDQSNATYKGKSEDTQYEQPSSVLHSKPAADVSPLLSYNSIEPAGSSKNKAKSHSSSLNKTTDGQNYGDTLNKKFSDLSVSDSSRGKLYDRYIQKRDAKLREDWSSNRADKEARLKSMQDSLERSRSEMKAKFSLSTDRQNSASSASRRAERLRSYNSRSSVKREQPSLDFEDSEDDADALDLLEKDHRQDRALDDISSGEGVSRSSQVKKHLPNNRNVSSSTPRASAEPAPRSANKVSTYSGKRRMQPENPLAQSVPNFSDLRKENTKPYSGGSKGTRSQVRNYARSKSTNEDTPNVKDDKSRRLHATRKSSANPREFREMSSLDPDVVDLTPIKLDEEVPKSGGPRPFLKKGSRAGFVSQASIQRQRASMGSKLANTVDENDDVTSEQDEPGHIVKEEVEEEFKIPSPEENPILEEEDPTPRLESDKFLNSGSENGDGTLTFSRVGQVLGSQLSSEISSSYLPVDVQDWTTESPMSWNSHSQHTFSYPHEMFDVDASADSPVASPASWNSHSLNQMDTDAARMRKKWGMAQKPMLVAHSTNNSRKDMTRGFKRLLKFGRKNRGSESLVDWISATTSEGDDDMEDGRDLANRSSEDLRKSRMGFSQAQPSDDSFNEHEVFGESVQSSESSIPAPPANFKLREDHLSGSSIKAPRSFFSLPTFRSKGSESKPR
ncbi:uncharacterized protein LOC127254686 [Andrographis paniculata]|uniref:uncharacterized protein LOC127254686 n=1 Tax=Andrographis paniculata TaxID=175694 RepID=UPI0021E6F70E|nr:uncharacterized protein LOC127254686 [Andrographis paniculata]XP_051135882.1 uncharacterized protein LOC127254686 [Andrographis paniculata]XP_051135883.1 uncharacterized protein LOC127254686 [Andrographis paniculata]XP_051135884.1 uncharacterized protein LOC127254686 [Andrographis paniculata]XP_051135885.1 uncharacterized protein LOC127254686 [Andrographis paniculata]XP_051135886.1 uncharacterized protein LOC127254686 [Andrographis paniculata]